MTDYGCAKHIPSSTLQWRLPVSIQLVLGGIMMIGLFFLKESPRWLCKKGRHEKAIASLAHVRCKSVDSPEIIQEMAEIRASIEEELNATEGVTWRECLTPGNRKRFAIGFMIMFWQQFSGTNSIGKYVLEPFHFDILANFSWQATMPPSTYLNFSCRCSCSINIDYFADSLWQDLPDHWPQQG